MAFSPSLKRTFDEAASRAHAQENPIDSMAFRIPIKRHRAQSLHESVRAELGAYGTAQHDDLDLGLTLVTKQRDSEAREAVKPAASPPALTYADQEMLPNGFAKDVLASRGNSLDFEMSGLSQVVLLGQRGLGDDAFLNMTHAEIQAAALLCTAGPFYDHQNDFHARRDFALQTGFENQLLISQMLRRPPPARTALVKPEPFSWMTDSSVKYGCFKSYERQPLLTSAKQELIEAMRLAERESSGAAAVVAKVEDGGATTAPGSVEVCAECQKVFKRKIYLQRHMEREHWLPAKVFKCEDCKYETKHQSNLSVHRRTHTGERPYHCGACGQRYTQGHLLKSHIRSRHAGNLRFYNLDKRSESTRGRKSLDFKHDGYANAPTDKHSQHLLSMLMTEPGAVCLRSMFMTEPGAVCLQSSELGIQFARRISQFLPGLQASGGVVGSRDWAVSDSAKVKADLHSNRNSRGQVAGGGDVGSRRIQSNQSYQRSASPGVSSAGVTQVTGDESKVSPVFHSTDEKIRQSLEANSWCCEDGLSEKENRQQNNLGLISYDHQSVIVDNSRSILVEDGFPRAVGCFGGHEAQQDLPEDLTVRRRKPGATIQEALDTAVVQQDDGGGGASGETGCRLQQSISNERSSLAFITGNDENQCKDAEVKMDSEVCYEESIEGPRPETSVSSTSPETPKESSPAGAESTKSRAEMPAEVPIIHSSSGFDGSHQDSTPLNSQLFAEDYTKRKNPDSNPDNQVDRISSGYFPRTSPIPRGKVDDVLPITRSLPAAEAVFEDAICPHFRKLQKFRRIVFRFVNAFAPNSLGFDDDSLAESDVIDEVVHAAMFNDVE